MKPIDYFHSTVAQEFFYLFCGEQIGEGQFRQVYRHGTDPSLVVKFDLTNAGFHNVQEWLLWREAEDCGYDIRHWLAPCCAISQSGSVLIQQRTDSLPRASLPAWVPSVLTDLKPDNWGLLDGRPVCHDYALTLLYDKALFGKLRVRPAEWR